MQGWAVTGAGRSHFCAHIHQGCGNRVRDPGCTHTHIIKRGLTSSSSTLTACGKRSLENNVWGSQRRNVDFALASLIPCRASQKVAPHWTLGCGTGPPFLHSVVFADRQNNLLHKRSPLKSTEACSPQSKHDPGYAGALQKSHRAAVWNQALPRGPHRGGSASSARHRAYHKCEMNESCCNLRGVLHGLKLTERMKILIEGTYRWPDAFEQTFAH